MSKKLGAKELKSNRQGHQTYSLNLSTSFYKKAASTPTSESSFDFKIHVFRAEINSTLGLQDLSPVITIKYGRENKKTKADSYRDPYNAVFNELGQATIDIKNPLVCNFEKIALLDVSNSFIGYLYFKLILPTSIMQIQESKSQDERRLLTTDNIQISNGKYTVPHKIEEREAKTKINLNDDPGRIKENKKIPHLHNKSDDPVVSSQSRGAFYKRPHPDNYNNDNDVTANSAVSKSTSNHDAGLDFDYREIEKVYEELQEEKKKIGQQATRLRKFQFILSNKEQQLDQEKSALYKKRDYLTEKENSLVEEKKQLQEQINVLDNDRLKSEEKKEILMIDIKSIKQRLLKHRLKHKILSKKLDEQTKQMDEAYQKLFGLQESLRVLQEPLNTALSFIELDASMMSFVNENKYQNQKHDNQIRASALGLTSASKLKKKILAKPRVRSMSLQFVKKSKEEALTESFILKEIKKERFLFKRLKKEAEEIASIRNSLNREHHILSTKLYLKKQTQQNPVKHTLSDPTEDFSAYKINQTSYAAAALGIKPRYLGEDKDLGKRKLILQKNVSDSMAFLNRRDFLQDLNNTSK